MATAYSKRDVNRFSKTYRYVRQAPRFEYQVPETLVGDGTPGDLESPTSVETDVLSFEGGGVVTYIFTRTYRTAPHVFVTPELESMSLAVESVNLISATVRSSADTNGLAHIHVISTLEGDGTSTPVISFARKVDITRFSKLYSYLRKSALEKFRIPAGSISSVFVEPLETERSTVTFAGADTVSYTFSRTYSSVPVVVISPNDNLNVFIDSISTTQVVIGSSTESNASVDIQVISVDV